MRRSGDLWVTWEKRVMGDLQLQGIASSRLFPEIRNLYSGHPKKVKSDVDFVLAINGKTTWMDTKATQDPAWSISTYVMAEHHVHQWAKLKAVTTMGSRGGYLIWFYTLKQIVWCPTQAIDLAKQEGRATIIPSSPLCTSQSDETQIFFKKLIYAEEEPLIRNPKDREP